MVKRVILAFRFPRDYLNDKTRDEITDEAVERLKILHKRITVDYYRNKLSKIRILTEAYRLDDLHASVFAKLFNDPDLEVTPVVNYDGLLQELGDISEESYSDTTVFIFLHVSSEIAGEIIRRWNEVVLFSFLPHGIMLPVSPDYLALVIDRHFNKPEWIHTETLHKHLKPQKAEAK